MEAAEVNSLVVGSKKPTLQAHSFQSPAPELSGVSRQALPRWQSQRIGTADRTQQERLVSAPGYLGGINGWGLEASGRGFAHVCCAWASVIRLSMAGLGRPPERLHGFSHVARPLLGMAAGS